MALKDKPYINGRFNRAIPGWSMTQSTNPWAKPSRFSDVGTALTYVIESTKTSGIRNRIKKLLYAGTPVPVLARTIGLQGFAENMWNPDVLELMQPALQTYLTYIGIEDNPNVPLVLTTTTEQDEATAELEEDMQLLEMMKAKNPELAEAVRRYTLDSNKQAETRQNEEIRRLSEEKKVEMANETKRTQGFLSPKPSVKSGEQA